MTQLPLYRPRENGPTIAAYGGGVNSVAMILTLYDEGTVPVEIVMADPGDEKRGTLAYRDNVMNPWLVAHGFPSVVVVSRASEAQYRPRASKTPQGTLREECMRIKALPSIAYGWKKCSLKYKAEPGNWYIARQQWALDAWARGERITRCIGYDAGEPSRARPEFVNGIEARRFIPRYPLQERGIDREECEDIIRAHGLAVPPKSSCRWCPNNTLEEWEDLRENDPEGYADALAMEANAEIDVPDVVGLMRCMPHGKRQLRVWNGDRPTFAREEEMPCECSL